MTCDAYQDGAPIRPGFAWRQRIIVSASYPVFPGNCKLFGQVRYAVGSEVLAELSTENGAITIIDENTIDIEITPTQSKGWRVKSVKLDLARTDFLSPEHLGFELEIPVKFSITQVEGKT